MLIVNWWLSGTSSAHQRAKMQETYRWNHSRTATFGDFADLFAQLPFSFGRWCSFPYDLFDDYGRGHTRHPEISVVLRTGIFLGRLFLHNIALKPTSDNCHMPFRKLVSRVFHDPVRQLHSEQFPLVLQQLALSYLKFSSEVLLVTDQDKKPAVARSLLVKIGQVEHAVIHKAEVPEVIEDELVVRDEISTAIVRAPLEKPTIALLSRLIFGIKSNSRPSM